MNSFLYTYVNLQQYNKHIYPLHYINKMKMKSIDSVRNLKQLCTRELGMVANKQKPIEDATMQYLRLTIKGINSYVCCKL